MQHNNISKWCEIQTFETWQYVDKHLRIYDQILRNERAKALTYCHFIANIAWRHTTANINTTTTTERNEHS